MAYGTVDRESARGLKDHGFLIRQGLMNAAVDSASRNPTLQNPGVWRY